MNSFLSPALIAVTAGSILAVVLAVPYVAAQYRRYGRLGFWRLTGNVGLLVYVIALFTYTLMPFPDSTTLSVCVAPQTSPFAFVDDVRRIQATQGGRLVDNAAIMQVALNVVLFAPLGVLLRGLARRGVIVATLLGFTVSLLIELTQGTGMWGVYSCAYRMFDVDDLIANTAGAFAGSVLALPVFAFSGGPGERVPRSVTASRRLVGMVVDVFVVYLVGVIGTLGYALVAAGTTGVVESPTGATATVLSIGVPLTLQALSVVIGGVTLGERAVALRSVTGAVPAVLARPVRFIAGIGGYVLLTVAEFPAAGALLALLVVVSIVGAFVGDKRGLACGIVGMSVEDNIIAERPFGTESRDQIGARR